MLDTDRGQQIRVSILVLIPLLATVGAIVVLWNRYVFWHDIALLGSLYVLTGLGITIGYHRMLTHQGFKAPEWLRGILMICGAMAWEGSPIVWAATHIKHHAHSDENGDPHSPLEGFWHAHFVWLFARKNFPDPTVYAPQLVADRTAVFVDKTMGVWMALSLLIPFALGGWTGLLWGGGVRIFLLTHVTWSVNSICHTFGKRDFETTDESRNHWIVGLLGFGEGWHNNHHAFPRNAFHGLRWWQVDCSGLLIRFGELLGLLTDVQRVSSETQEAQRLRMQATRASAIALRQQLLANVADAHDELRRVFAPAMAAAESDRERSQLLSLQSIAMMHLHRLHEQLSQTTNMKKQRVLVHAEEFQRIMRQAKEGAMRRAQGVALQVSA